MDTTARHHGHYSPATWTLEPELVPRLARRWLIHLHLLSWTDFNQSFTSLSLQMGHLSAIRPDLSSVFQTADDVRMTQMTLSRAPPYSGAEPSRAEPSRAWLTSVTDGQQV